MSLIVNHNDGLNKDLQNNGNIIGNNDLSTFASYNYIHEIAKFPLLTPEEEKYLAKKISNGDISAKEKFINSNLRLVVFIARQIWTSINNGARIVKLDFDDLIQEGNLGLLKAVESFDYTKGFRFSTYAGWWIRLYISRSISKSNDLIKFPLRVQEKINQYQSFQSSFYKINGRYATNQEASNEILVSMCQIEEIKLYINYCFISLSTPVSHEYDLELEDFIQDITSLTPEERIILSSRKEVLNMLISNSSLTEKEKVALLRRYDLENDRINTFESIAIENGRKAESVRILVKKAIEKLQKSAEKIYGKDFFLY